MIEVKVQNMTSGNGNEVPNQFIIHIEFGTMAVDLFQSYETMMAAKVWNKETGRHDVILRRNWKISKTTSKYLRMFLGMSTKDIEKYVEAGKILVVDEVGVPSNLIEGGEQCCEQTK